MTKTSLYNVLLLTLFNVKPIIAQRPFTGPVKPIYCGGEQVKMVITTQSLGLNIDDRLKWKDQHNRVTKSFSAKLRQLKRMKYLPRHVLEEIYQKSVLPTVTYGILVRGTCSLSLLDDLEHYHTRAAKMMYNIEQGHLTNKQILHKVNWKSIANIYKRRIFSFIYARHILHECPERPTESF